MRESNKFKYASTNLWISAWIDTESKPLYGYHSLIFEIEHIQGTLLPRTLFPRFLVFNNSKTLNMHEHVFFNFPLVPQALEPCILHLFNKVLCSFLGKLLITHTHLHMHICIFVIYTRFPLVIAKYLLTYSYCWSSTAKAYRLASLSEISACFPIKGLVRQPKSCPTVSVFWCLSIS